MTAFFYCKGNGMDKDDSRQLIETLRALAFELHWLRSVVEASIEASLPHDEYKMFLEWYAMCSEKRHTEMQKILDEKNHIHPSREI